MEYLVSNVNIKKRLRVCKAYKTLGIDEWKNVLFTYECRKSIKKEIAFKNLLTKIKLTKLELLKQF